MIQPSVKRQLPVFLQRSAFLKYSAVFLGFLLVCPRIAESETAFDLISGFDRDRLTNCFPIDSNQKVGEMAKLLYRLRNLDADALEKRSDSTSESPVPGDVVSIEGTISSIRQYSVPEPLVEFLELETIQELVLNDDQDNLTQSLFVPPLVGKVSKGDLIRANAVVISGLDRAYATGRVAWIPAAAKSVGWRLLAQQGVNLSAIAEAASRNRRPLESTDSEAFYSMLAAADQIAGRGTQVKPVPRPQSIEPVDLLQDPESYHGQWIRLKTNTVRITRVTITDTQRREQLGQDHYFQIDAQGDLGKYVVRLERKDDVGGDPIEMAGTYPITLVATKLPQFLREELDSDSSVVSMVSMPTSIDGFFFRLWSYKNEFMTREGGGKQVGPLIVVSNWKSLAIPAENGGGVELIGYALAAGILITIIGTFVWNRRNAKEDAAVREQTGHVKIDV